MMTCGIIFDMDGVLVDSAGPHWQSWRQLAEEIGRPITEPQFRATFGRQNQDVVPALFGHDDAPTIRRLSDRKEELYRDLIRHAVPAVDGAVELIRACHAAGFRLAVGSSGPPENVDLVVNGLNIGRYFQTFVTAREVTRGKPHPQVFQRAAEGLGLPPGLCAVVEDAPAGVEAARAAGCTAIALVGMHPAESLGKAHRVVTSLRELSPEAIATLIQQAAPA